MQFAQVRLVFIYYNIDTGKYHESDSKYLHECRRHECKYSYQTSDISLYPCCNLFIRTY